MNQVSGLGKLGGVVEEDGPNGERGGREGVSESEGGEALHLRSDGWLQRPPIPPIDQRLAMVSDLAIQAQDAHHESAAASPNSRSHCPACTLTALLPAFNLLEHFLSELPSFRHYASLLN